MHIVSEKGGKWQQHDRVSFPSKQEIPGIEPGPLGWQTSAITNELQEVRSS